MLASIHPLGERARHSRWGITVTAYVIGAAAGGVAAGAAAGGAGWLLHQALAWSDAAAAAIAAGLGLAGAAIDASPRLGVPSRRRQVNEDWLTTYRGWVYGAGFGFQLGLGVATIVTTALVYVVLALAALTASPAAGALVGLAFGLVRGLTVLAPARVRRPDHLRRFHRRFAAGARPAGRVAVAAQLGLAAVAALVVL